MSDDKKELLTLEGLYNILASNFTLIEDQNQFAKHIIGSIENYKSKLISVKQDVFSKEEVTIQQDIHGEGLKIQELAALNLQNACVENRNDEILSLRLTMSERIIKEAMII